MLASISILYWNTLSFSAQPLATIGYDVSPRMTPHVISFPKFWPIVYPQMAPSLLHTMLPNAPITASWHTPPNRPIAAPYYAPNIPIATP